MPAIHCLTQELGEKRKELVLETNTSGRIIGIRHRVKRTSRGEARPTQVAVRQGEKEEQYDLPDDTAELDWLLGCFPRSYRKVTAEDRLENVQAKHIKWRELTMEERPADFPAHLIKQVKDVVLVADKVPKVLDGFRAGDMVVMALGGSGDRLAFALSRRGEEIGASVLRLPSFVLKDKRKNDDKDNDGALLVRLVKAEPELLRSCTPRDRELIKIRELLTLRMEAMKERIACEQRLWQRLIGSIFLNVDGRYPEGSLEDLYESQKASDQILQALKKEEAKRLKELSQALEELDVYQEVFKPITGLGPAIAARLIASIGDIRLFPSWSKLARFCGVHVNPDGTFPRRRVGGGATNNQRNDEARQALYLLADQFNKRPDSLWGQKLRQYKKNLRVKHPEVVMVEVTDQRTGQTKSVKRYSDLHIMNMARWRTVTRFVRQLWRDWSRFEKARAKAQVMKPSRPVVAVRTEEVRA